MKMREVCRRTGLTERTVRYWASEGLIAPATYEQNGRVYFDFSEADIALLETVSILRRTGFSVAQIEEMERDGPAAGRYAAALRDSLRLQAEEQRRAADALEGGETCGSMEALAQMLAAQASARPLPELDPDFGRFELATPAERERSRARAAAENERLRRRRRRLRTLAGGVLLALLSVLLTLGVTGQLARPASTPAPGWAARISGGFDCPAGLTFGPEASLLCRGTDALTGRSAALLLLEGQETALLFRRVGEAEAEFLQPADFDAWQRAPAEGDRAAVCYFAAGTEIYEALALCETAEPLPLLTRAEVRFAENR